LCEKGWIILLEIGIDIRVEWMMSREAESFTIRSFMVTFERRLEFIVPLHQLIDCINEVLLDFIAKNRKVMRGFKPVEVHIWSLIWCAWRHKR